MPAHCSIPGPSLHLAFEACLPRMQATARFASRHLPDPDQQAEFQAETLALAWKHFLRLHQRGQDPTRFASTLARRCSQAVRAGRRLVRSEAARDVLSPVCQARRRLRVRTLETGDGLGEALRVNTVTPVPEQAAFRCDFPRWLGGLPALQRAVAVELMAGGSTQGVARQFGVTPARISQLRRELAERWRRFHGV